MIRVKQSALSAAVKAALLGAMTVGMVACDSEGDVSTTAGSTSVTEAADNIVGEVKGLTSDVTGVVVDTNGNPVAGARVYAPGKAAVTTDESGQYYFTDVKVTNVQGNNDETEGAGGPATEEDEIMQQISITIVAPEGFLGGVVTVRPEAQVNNTGGSDAATNDSDQNQTTVQTFVSGLLAEAGRAVLPQLSAKVSGYLDDCAIDTDQDGINEDPAVGVMVKADVLGAVAGGALTSNTGTAGATFALAVGDIPAATTDETGYFELTLPADLSANLLLEGWTSVVTGTQTLQASVSTQDEVVKQSLGQFDVCAISDASEDAAPKTDPQVVSVDGRFTEATITSGTVPHEYAILDDGVTNNFVVNFNVPLTGVRADGTFYLNDSDLVVTLNNAAAPEGTTVTLNAERTGATITFPEALGQAQLVDLFIPEWKARDVDGEFVGQDAEDEGQTYIDENHNASNGTKEQEASQFVRVSFCTFEEPSVGGNIVLVEQIIDADTSEDAGLSSLAEYSSVFADNIVAGTLTQLNSAEPADTAARLNALAEQITAGASATAATDANNALITYTDLVGTADWSVTSGTLADLGDGKVSVVDTVDGATVTATVNDIFGIEVSSQSLQVFDRIAPTTVLQESYAITTAGAPYQDKPLVVNGGTPGVNFGNGGEASELVGEVTATLGNPIIYVQARHLQPRTSTSDLSIQARGTEFNALTDDMAARLATGENDINEYNGRPLYDEVALNNWGAIGQKIGVAFSENVALVAGTTLVNANIAGGIGSIVAHNDVLKNVDGTDTNLTDVDLVDVNFSDVVALANEDHGELISFSGLVQDLASTPNVTDAASNAQVAFIDALPPMITSARWNGTTLVVEFNENISVDNDDFLTIINPVTDVAETIDLDQAVANAANSADAGDYTVSGTTLTVVTDSSLANIGAAFVGTSTVNSEFFYNDGGVAGTEQQHAVLNWDNIEDARGNSWGEYQVGGALAAGQNAATLAAGNRWEVNAPQFLAVNEVSAFLNTGNNVSGLEGLAGAIGNNVAWTAELKYTHALNVNEGVLNSLTDKTGTSTLTLGEINALFYIDVNSDSLVDANDITAFPAGTTASISTNSASEGVITLSVPASAAMSNIIVGQSELMMTCSSVSLTTDVGDSLAFQSVTEALAEGCSAQLGAKVISSLAGDEGLSVKIVLESNN